MYLFHDKSLLCSARFEEANFMRLPSKRRTLGSGHGARETLDELVDLGALPSSSSSSLAGKKRRQGSVGSGKRKAARKGQCVTLQSVWIQYSLSVLSCRLKV